jgi:hypothetical protein
MRISPREIPNEMKSTIIMTTKVQPQVEKDTTSILREIRMEEEGKKKGNKRATFFVNLIYLMSLGLFSYMIYAGEMLYALPALALTTLGAFIFNLFIFSESQRTKKRQTLIDNFYLEYTFKKTHPTQ